ncbi:MAG TPA: anhydro-N-acetylmuramic acid kinase [Bacteroidia bacterium]|nr:anhydro-N-acetylmuramic acid kinase [Bacteroidia bacterium]
MNKPLTILGVMSGTSLDGVDLALCTFDKNGRYTIEDAKTISYSENWVNKLVSAEKCGGRELILLHREYGQFLGELCKEFTGNSVKPDFIASHGHTIFHEPHNGLTFQLGCGAELAVASGADTISDFRSTDVARGGQGAPLVPIGDALLFGEYTYCLNLGGFVNVSSGENDKRIAFDIAPMNYVMNRIAKREGMSFDENGSLAAAGKYIPELGAALDSLDYYSAAPPKSLGREWTEKFVLPLMKSEYSSADLLHTFSVHVAKQVAKNCPREGKMLVTGGGAYNAFFIGELTKISAPEICIPDDCTIQFKEALVFAFLGFLRANGSVNALASVTGAMRDSCTGSIYLA